MTIGRFASIRCSVYRRLRQTIPETIAYGYFFANPPWKSLSQLREKRGLSQTQLADLVQIGRARLSQIENGAVAARIDTLHALAMALEMPLSELVEGL